MKNGFKVMDWDLHTMEPDDLWETYLAEPFRKVAPTFTRGARARAEPAGHPGRRPRRSAR